MNQIERELKKVFNYLAVSENKDTTLSSIEHQLKLFENGVKIPQLLKPCTIGDGIVEFKKDDFDDFFHWLWTPSRTRLES